ncbi:MAG: dienelactone hydrolase family protein [Gemmatimonadota bacterium]
MNSQRDGARGIASYILIAVMATVVGASGTWFLRRPHLATDAITTHGEWVHFRSGTDSVRAYVAYPERKDKAPGIIVIHEIFGATDWEPTVADRLAKNGYVAIMPDLLSSKYGMTPATTDSGRKLIATLEPDRITADLNATYAYLNGLPAVQKDHIGTIGFCWGGGQSFRYATNNPNLKAAVVCYGPPPDSTSLARVNASVLGVYGENDERIDGTIPDVDRIMKVLGKSYSHDMYPGTGHGFLKPGRVGSDGPEVEKAWTRILGFYQASLK